MSDFDPGDGWREVALREVFADQERVMFYSGDRGMRYWVRQEPVPFLPTEPYTVIRATWGPAGRGAVQETYVLTHATYLWANVNTGVRHDQQELQGGITGFEVLAEPRTIPPKERDAIVRRETAKAVLYRVELSQETYGHVDIGFLRQEFEVES